MNSPMTVDLLRKVSMVLVSATAMSVACAQEAADPIVDEPLTIPQVSLDDPAPAPTSVTVPSGLPPVPSQPAVDGPALEQTASDVGSPDAIASEDESGEAMLRGPVHEAFAEQVNLTPVTFPVISVQPPDPVVELPPDVRPEGREVEWIPGYWAWDDDENDFLWVSGIWREVPQGFRWLPGYWSEVDGGYQWISGTWVSEQTAEIDYLDTVPPQTLESGPVGDPPTAQHIWIPGCWMWSNVRYEWRPGFWSTGYTNWIWVPARYHWTPRGYYFCSGYWDYPLERRGVLFAPHRFQRPVLSRADFSFTPRIVVSAGLLSQYFWVRPNYSHYYFGDYYGSPFASRGFVPWHHYYRQSRGCEPLFAYYGRQSGFNSYFNQLNVHFNLLLNSPTRRPPQTFREQLPVLAASNPVPDRQNHFSHDHRLLGARLDQVVDQSSGVPDETRFVKLAADNRKHVHDQVLQLREITTARRDVEATARHVHGESQAPDHGHAKVSRTDRRDADDAPPGSSGEAERPSHPATARTEAQSGDPARPAAPTVPKVADNSAGSIASAEKKNLQPPRLKLPPRLRSENAAVTITQNRQTNDESKTVDSSAVANGSPPQQIPDGRLPNTALPDAAGTKSEAGSSQKIGRTAGSRTDNKAGPSASVNRDTSAAVPGTPETRGEIPRGLSGGTASRQTPPVAKTAQAPIVKNPQLPVTRGTQAPNAGNSGIPAGAPRTIIPRPASIGTKVPQGNTGMQSAAGSVDSLRSKASVSSGSPGKQPPSFGLQGSGPRTSSGSVSGQVRSETPGTIRSQPPSPRTDRPAMDVSSGSASPPRSSPSVRPNTASGIRINAGISGGSKPGQSSAVTPRSGAPTFGAPRQSSQSSARPAASSGSATRSTPGLSGGKSGEIRSGGRSAGASSGGRGGKK